MTTIRLIRVLIVSIQLALVLVPVRAAVPSTMLMSSVPPQTQTFVRFLASQGKATVRVKETSLFSSTYESGSSSHIAWLTRT